MPNSKAQYEKFLAKQASGSPVSWGDVAARLDNEEEAMLHYMVENDLNQVWRLLHQSDTPSSIGRGMSFAPDRSRAEGELKLLLVKQDNKTLAPIVEAFRINMNANNYTTNADLIRQMELLQTISMKDGGYGFNLAL